MSLLHIGVALGLSAAAAFLVTGVTMRPIKPNVAITCSDGGPDAAVELPCRSTADERPAGNTSSIRPDSGRSGYGY